MVVVDTDNKMILSWSKQLLLQLVLLAGAGTSCSEHLQQYFERHGMECSWMDIA